MRSGERTRHKLVDSAMLLWAERGLDGVSLAEINRHAGQRNSSALHYHFGSRDAILAAMYSLFIPGIRSRRDEYLHRAQQQPDSPRAAAEAIILPIAALLYGDWRGRAYLQIAANDFGNTSGPLSHELLAATATNLAERMLADRLNISSPELRGIRFRVGGTMMLHAIADYARRLQAHGADIDPERTALFVDNLVDMYLAALGAPPDRSVVDRLKLQTQRGFDG